MQVQHPLYSPHLTAYDFLLSIKLKIYLLVSKNVRNIKRVISGMFWETHWNRCWFPRGLFWKKCTFHSLFISLMVYIYRLILDNFLTLLCKCIYLCVFCVPTQTKSPMRIYAGCELIDKIYWWPIINTYNSSEKLNDIDMNSKCVHRYSHA